MRPETSRTSVPASGFNPCPTAATLPPEKATSATASSFWDGSITRPPRRIKSKGIVFSERDIKGRGWSASVGQDHLWRGERGGGVVCVDARTHSARRKNS